MNNQKSLVIIVLIVLVVLFAGATTYLALRKPTETPAQYSSSQPIKPGWKTYFGANFEVQYPENTFAVVQTKYPLPPDYKFDHDAIKLISLAKAGNLGKQECYYGESGLISVCNAEKEGGIEFLQVNASAQSLTSTIDSSLKNTVTLAGKQIVKSSIGAGGEGTDTHYIPLNSNQTLIVVRHYRSDNFPQEALFNQVLATLVIK